MNHGIKIAPLLLQTLETVFAGLTSDKVGGSYCPNLCNNQIKPAILHFATDFYQSAILNINGNLMIYHCNENINQQESQDVGQDS